MALNHIVPTAIQYQNTLLENLKGLQDVYGTAFKTKAKEQLILLDKTQNYIDQISSEVLQMKEERKKANQVNDIEKKAVAYVSKVAPYLSSIRHHCDELELIVDDALWPLAKYRELLFIR